MTVDDANDYANWEDFNFHQFGRKFNPAWILLDNCSTTDIFCNKQLLTDIHCNAGTNEVKQVGTLMNYDTVWYSASAIMNILSLAQVKKTFPITYDSNHGNQFVVNKPHHDVVFKESPSGLYYHDTANREYGMLNIEKADMVDTFKANREGFTDRDYERAKIARKALGLVGYPSPMDFKNMVRSNMINNCTVTSPDIANANKIFGPDRPTLRGNIVRIKPSPVVTDYVQIPREIVSLNNNVTLLINIMFVNSLPFMVSVSRKIKFTTLEFLHGRKQPQLVTSIKNINLYQTRGFTVDTTLMDRKFECLRSDLAGLNLNTTSAREHVPDVERQIRVLKERSRAIRSTLPFKSTPGRMIIELVYYAALWLNAFPPSSGVSYTYSPRTIMTGTTLDFAKHCNLPFGAYAEAHEE
jgi:hypothetical protein